LRIVVLGSTGMLGNVVGKYLIGKYGKENVALSYRKSILAYGFKVFYFDAFNEPISLPDCDYIINCIGAIWQDKKS